MHVQSMRSAQDPPETAYFCRPKTTEGTPKENILGQAAPTVTRRKYSNYRNLTHVFGCVKLSLNGILRKWEDSLPQNLPPPPRNAPIYILAQAGRQNRCKRQFLRNLHFEDSDTFLTETAP